MNTVKEYCPYCKEIHEVESKGILCIQLVDNSTIHVYKCLVYNKEFRIRKHVKET